jgi:hypothetical protein
MGSYQSDQWGTWGILRLHELKTLAGLTRLAEMEMA